MQNYIFGLRSLFVNVWGRYKGTKFATWSRIIGDEFIKSNVKSYCYKIDVPEPKNVVK